MHDFLIVEFSDDLSVAVVYKSWFRKTTGRLGFVSWPPTRNVTAAVVKKAQPKESWTVHAAKILSESGMHKVTVSLIFLNNSVLIASSRNICV